MKFILFTTCMNHTNALKALLTIAPLLQVVAVVAIGITT